MFSPLSFFTTLCGKKASFYVQLQSQRSPSNAKWNDCGRGFHERAGKRKGLRPIRIITGRVSNIRDSFKTRSLRYSFREKSIQVSRIETSSLPN